MDVSIRITDKFLKTHALFWNFFVQGQRPPDNIYPVLLMQSLNTPGTEVTPGSGKIGKNFQLVQRIHALYPEMVIMGTRT
jgi:hypothetical protein